jgi:cell wall-associated NlpC family hydrolase
MKKHIITIIITLFLLVIISDKAFSSGVTYKVKSGDSLYSISKNYHVSIDKLKNINNLKTTKLKLGQLIVISKDGVRNDVHNTQVNHPQTETNITENDEEFIEYTVKKSDTLDTIAMRFNIEKEDILESNNLKDTKRLSPGKILLIPKIIEEKEDELITLTNKSLKPWKNNDEQYVLVKVAKSFMGAPYRYGGNTVRGLDCSAFVKKIYDIFDVQLPRSAKEQFKIGTKISKEELSIGDLVFFKTKRYAKYPTHVGIYIGDGNFIHSSSGHSKIGVKIDALSSDYYTKTYIGATRLKKSPDESAEVTKNPEKTSNNS